MVAHPPRHTRPTSRKKRRVADAIARRSDGLVEDHIAFLYRELLPVAEDVGNAELLVAEGYIA